MPLHRIPRKIYEAIRATAREEVYDAIYRQGAYLTHDEEMKDWLCVGEPAEDGVELIEDETTDPAQD